MLVPSQHIGMHSRAAKPRSRLLFPPTIGCLSAVTKFDAAHSSFPCGKKTHARHGLDSCACSPLDSGLLRKRQAKISTLPINFTGCIQRFSRRMLYAEGHRHKEEIRAVVR